MSSPKKRKRIIIWIILIALVAGAYPAYLYFFKENKVETPYKKIKVERGEIRISILSTGTVAPENRLDIKPPIAGRVERVLVDEGAEVKKGQTLAWMSSTERAGILDSASARGAAAVKEWEQLFKATPILAPISGTIIKRSVVSGQTFGTGDAVYTMSDFLVVQAQVDETDLAQVSLNQKATIVLDAFPDDVIPAHVDKIAFDATTVNNVTVYIVHVVPEHAPKFMRSGMTANVSFDVNTKTNILVITNGALKVRDGKSYVLLPAAKPEEKPVEREVTTGLSDGKQVELLSGLKEGDTILVPEFKLGEANATSSPFSPFSRPAPKKPAS